MGLTFKELNDLLEYIKKNHSWENMFNMTPESKLTTKKLIKYVNFSVDTRTNTICYIKFHNIHCSKDLVKKFRACKEYDFKDEIYKWLQQED